MAYHYTNIYSYSHNNNSLSLPNPTPTNVPTMTTTTSTTTTPSSYFTYSIPGMDITPGPILFTYISEFLSIITTEKLPLVSIRDVIHSNLTFTDFTTNALENEFGFALLITIFAILAIVPLIATCCWCCCSARNTADDVEVSRRSSSVYIADEALKGSLHYRKRASMTTLWFVFFGLVFSDICIFYANTRLAASVEMTPEMIKSTVHDMEVFLKDTHLQIKHKLDNGFHVSIEKVVKDLEDVDVLLGEPIQAEISAHTGIELAYDSLATLSLANAELIYRVLMLQETVGRALKISQEAAARMEELQIQLSVLQRQCTYRDRPLCDTLRIRSFEENGIIDALKTLQEDQTIFRMRYLGEIEFGATVKNLTSEVGVSRSIFSNFPQQVKHDTEYQRNYTLQQLDDIRHRTTANVQVLTATINALLGRLQGTWESIEDEYKIFEEWSRVYWTSGWVTTVIIIWVLLFMLMSYCCFLCEANVKAGFVLFIAVLIICLASICIMLFGVATLTIGGNSEIFLCRALYDDDVGGVGGGSTTKTMSTLMTNMATITRSDDAIKYELLGKLFDKPGYIYEIEPQTGIIGELLRPDGVNRSIVNVSLASALSGCEQNLPSYNVFQLDAFVNTTQIADLKQFPKVTAAIDAIDVSERTLLSLTQTIQNILESMLQTSSFNLTTYRASIGAPTPEKDLATFIDQMQRVALQIQDVATSSRMTTLGSRSKRLQASILQPLEQLQNEILYHLTALELQRDPWAKQVNQTLNHLRNIQGYLEKTAGEICQNQTKLYTERLKTYLFSSKATMSSQLGDTTAKCRAFFDIFDANRIFYCRNMVDFVNAIFFFTFLTLLLWAIGTPVGLNLMGIQRRLNILEAQAARALERSDSERSRRRVRSSSTIRERSTSRTTAGRPKKPLRRSATEETLDIVTDEVDEAPQREYREQRDTMDSRDMRTMRDTRDMRDMRDTREMRDMRSREREVSRPRDVPTISSSVSTGRGRQKLQRQGTAGTELDLDMDDNWPSSGQSRATSTERERDRERDFDRDREREHEHEREREKQRQREREREQNQQRMQPMRNLIQQVSQRITKPSLRKQGTEDFDLEGEEEDAGWRPPVAQRLESRSEQDQRRTGTANRNIRKMRRTDQDTLERSSRRSMTPILTPSPDAQAATPLPRTPARLKSRVSLTTRAVSRIMKQSSPDNRNKRNKQIKRQGTDEFELDDSDTYGAPASNPAAVAAARRTPPRGAPPPPPPPAPGMNRFGSNRNVRWDSNEDIEFEDLDAPDPKPDYINQSYVA